MNTKTKEADATKTHDAEATKKAEHEAKLAAEKAAKEKAEKAAADKLAAEEKAAKAKAEKEAKDKEKAEKKAAKEKAAADAKAAKEAAKMPESNGVRRPKPEGKCGQAWAVMDRMSAEKGSPVAIGDLIPETDKLGLNQTNVRCEYAQWKKFYGVKGRIEKVADAAATTPAGTATA